MMCNCVMYETSLDQADTAAGELHPMLLLWWRYQQQRRRSAGAAVLGS